MGCLDSGIELQVILEVELLGQILYVSQRFRLGREVLGPVPLIKNLLGK